MTSEPSEKQTAEESLIKLVQQLSHVITYSESSNFDTNKKLWNNYAKNWSKDADFVKKMVQNLPDAQNTSPQEYLTHLGKNCFVFNFRSDKESLREVLNDFVFPYLTDSSIVAELGCGGGRVAVQVSPRVQKLYCLDIAEEMIKHAKKALKDRNNVEFHLLHKPQLPTFLHNTLDFIYAFDVFPHIDLHTLWKYIQEIKLVLKAGGKAFIHTANITTPLGWNRFVRQDKYTPGGFYFISPEIVHTLIDKTNAFKIIKTSQHSVSNNMYYNRDYLVLLEKI